MFVSSSFNTYVNLPKKKESSGHLSQLSNKIKMSSFGLLELKIWMNTEQYLGCRTNSDISFVAII
jgi:hypothetical protein